MNKKKIIILGVLCVLISISYTMLANNVTRKTVVTYDDSLEHIVIAFLMKYREPTGKDFSGHIIEISMLDKKLPDKLLSKLNKNLPRVRYANLNKSQHHETKDETTLANNLNLIKRITIENIVILNENQIEIHYNCDNTTLGGAGYIDTFTKKDASWKLQNTQYIASRSL